MRQEALFGPATEIAPATRSEHFHQSASSSRLGELPKHDPSSGQLPMMMTAREIRHHYRAVDGDRHDVWDHHNDEYRYENDTELFERKLEEAHGSPHDYGHYETSPHSTGARPSVRGASTLSSGETLVDRLKGSNFELRNPISLQFHSKNMWPHNQVDPDTGESTSDARPQILGGHHRVAVLNAYAPNKLQPVNHEQDVTSARSALGDRY